MALTARNDATTFAPNLYVALELSKDTWKLGFTTSRAGKVRIRDVRARDTAGFLGEVEAAKRYFGLDEDVRVFSCYEAGRDGFWLHHFLEANGIGNRVVDPASIEKSRRSRNPKTDLIDARKLAQLLAREHDGEDTLRAVRVPPLEAETERLLPRKLKSLKKRRTQLTNRIRAELFVHGVDLDPREGDFKKQSFLRAVAQARQWDGSPLPPEVVFMVKLEWEQFRLIETQLRDLAQRQRRALREARRGSEESTESQRKAALLTDLRGVGDVGAYVLTTEFFGWREFNNRKEVGALAGLTGTPFASGKLGKEQGISKAGNPRVRTLMIELAWLWLRWQPKSRLTRWFHDHVGKAGSRGKRRAIVALARKLLVAFWHFVEHKVVPEGAVLKPGASLGHSEATA